MGKRTWRECTFIYLKATIYQPSGVEMGCRTFVFFLMNVDTKWLFADIRNKFKLAYLKKKFKIKFYFKNDEKNVAQIKLEFFYLRARDFVCVRVSAGVKAFWRDWSVGRCKMWRRGERCDQRCFFLIIIIVETGLLNIFRNWYDYFFLCIAKKKKKLSVSASLRAILPTPTPVFIFSFARCSLSSCTRIAERPP